MTVEKPQLSEQIPARPEASPGRRDVDVRNSPDDARSETSIGDHGGSIRDLGLLTDVDGDDALIGVATVVPELFVPGTDVVRTSVLATWADVVAGKFANTRTAPNICMTLDLDVHLTRTPTGPGFEPGDEILCRSWMVRAGRRIVVMGFDLSAAGAPFGFGHAGFMASPDPDHVHHEGFGLVSDPSERGRLDRPFAERVGVRRVGPGRVEVPYDVDNVNATRSVQGGLLALAAEEAVLELRPRSVCGSMSIRYLRAVRDAPAVATASLDGDVARVEVAAGVGGPLATLVTARLAG